MSWLSHAICRVTWRHAFMFCTLLFLRTYLWAWGGLSDRARKGLTRQEGQSEMIQDKGKTLDISSKGACICEGACWGSVIGLNQEENKYQGAWEKTWPSVESSGWHMTIKGQQALRNKVMWAERGDGKGEIPGEIPVVSVICVDLVRDKLRDSKMLKGKLPERWDTFAEGMAWSRSVMSRHFFAWKFV